VRGIAIDWRLNAVVSCQPVTTERTDTSLHTIIVDDNRSVHGVVRSAQLSGETCIVCVLEWFGLDVKKSRGE